LENARGDEGTENVVNLLRNVRGRAWRLFYASAPMKPAGDAR